MVMLAMVLTSVGLPVDGIALVAGVDRIFDMGRTVVNITGDASCSIIVSNMAFLVSLVARNKNEIIGVSSMCAGSTYYFLLFKAVWVLPGNWAKK